MFERRPKTEVAPTDPDSFARELEADASIVQAIRVVSPDASPRFDELAAALSALATLARSYREARAARRADDGRARHEALVAKAFEVSSVDAALVPLCFGRPKLPPPEPSPRSAPPHDPAAPLPIYLSLPAIFQ